VPGTLARTAIGVTNTNSGRVVSRQKLNLLARRDPKRRPVGYLVGGNSPHGDHPLSIPMIAVTGGTSRRAGEAMRQAGQL
jgi:hypothetical protein